MGISQIHFYDVEESVPDNGWVHYTSRVPGFEGIDGRVADVVRTVEDVSSATVGFVGAPHRPDLGPQLAQEAVRISLAAPKFFGRIMTPTGSEASKVQ